MRDEQSKFLAKQVTTIGVNPASVVSHEKYSEGFKFTFPLLSDSERSIAGAYHALKPDGRGIQRTVYLIGTDGRVRFAERGAPAADAVLKALDG